MFVLKLLFKSRLCIQLQTPFTLYFFQFVTEPSRKRKAQHYQLCLAAIAVWNHPFPSRTGPWNEPAPMIVCSSHAKVGHRQAIYTKSASCWFTQSLPCGGFFVSDDFIKYPIILWFKLYSRYSHCYYWSSAHENTFFKLFVSLSFASLSSNWFCGC